MPLNVTVANATECNNSKGPLICLVHFVYLPLCLINTELTVDQPINHSSSLRVFGFFSFLFRNNDGHIHWDLREGQHLALVNGFLLHFPGAFELCELILNMLFVGKE